jgi:hypothetical protein
MNVRKNRKKMDLSGSTFDSFLEEGGIREEVEAVAIKRVLAWATGTGHAGTAKNKAGDGEAASYQSVTTGSPA